MTKIYLKLDKGVPQYACSSCSNCRSLFGKSLCSIKNRGCCWYFPKFTLHEIHKMAKSLEGLDILNSMLKLPGIKVYNYYLHAKGYFDEVNYKKYMERVQGQEDDVEDKSIFFRVCPFVKGGKGCTLPVKYRSAVCNFFICREVIEDIEKQDVFKDYIKERDSYVRWVEWENNSLEMLLREKGLTLADNFDEVIDTLRDIPLEPYEFPYLPPIESDGGFSIGA